MTDDPFERAVSRVEAATEKADAERRARRQERSRSGRRKALSIHATVFVAVQLLIVAVWALTWATAGDSYPWFVYPLLGWAVGLAAHYAAVHEHLRRH